MKTLQFVNGPGILDRTRIMVIDTFLDIHRSKATGLGKIFGNIIYSRARTSPHKVNSPNINNNRTTRGILPVLRKRILGDIVTVNNDMKMVREFYNSIPRTNRISAISESMKEGIHHSMNIKKIRAMTLFFIIPQGQGH